VVQIALNKSQAPNSKHQINLNNPLSKYPNYPSPLRGISANFTLPTFHLPHPHPNPPLEREGIIGGTFLIPPPSRGRLGGGWGEGIRILDIELLVII